MKALLHTMALVGLLAGITMAARADVVSLYGAENSRNIAQISIEKDGATVLLEVLPADLMVFQDALSDEWFKADTTARLPRSRRWDRFATEVFGFTADGKTLPVEIGLVETRTRIARYSPLAGKTNPYTGRPIPGPPNDKRVVYLELAYPFPVGTRPSKLVINPPLSDEGISRAQIGFTVHHLGVQVVDFSPLNKASVLHLDWEDPWYSRFEGGSLKRWQDSGMMTFLYIEPYEVRHEMLVRVKDMESLLDLGLRDPDWIEEDEFRRVENAIGEFLRRHSNVNIDGVLGKGILDKVNFVQYTRRRTLFLTEPERLSVPSAMLGVVVTYFTEGLPQEVTMEWDLFTDRILQVPAKAIDPAGPFPTYLTPDDPVHTWDNFLKTYRIPTVDAIVVDPAHMPFQLPALSIVLCLGLLPVGLAWRRKIRSGESGKGSLWVGGILVIAALVAYPLVTIDAPGGDSGGLDGEQSEMLVKGLLRNIYRAFDFRNEEDVYDKLAVTVAGDLLTEIYLLNRQSFVVQQAGGAQAKVETVEIKEAAPERAGPGYLFDTTWSAAGSVGHWGHFHYRTNRYRALITAVPEGGAWKIVGLEVLEETRLDPLAIP
jgi:hypothetical protein